VEPFAVGLRALFAYAVLLVLLRCSGKRTVAESTPFTFVLALVIGDMVDDVLLAEVGPAQFAVAVSTLAVAQILVAWAASRQPWLDRLVSGVPRAVVVDGAPVRAQMRAARMNEKTLAFELRHHGLQRERWADVKAAYVEVSGAVSMIGIPAARPAQRGDALAARRP
jgi:uncharacterized membrane protein YcaP (DUF421 family)